MIQFIKMEVLFFMISDVDYNNFKKHLFLDSTYPLLYETSLEYADSILQNGISLKKEYNAQIDRVVSLPKSENDFKNYHYHVSITNPAIIVVSIPKSLFRNIQIQTSTAHLFLNCFLQKDMPSSTISTSNMKVYPVKFQKCASTLPNIWVNGYFNQSTGFICNPRYILRQENAQNLLASQETSIWEKFVKYYPEEAYMASHTPNNIRNPINTEYEK